MGVPQILKWECLVSEVMTEVSIMEPLHRRKRSGTHSAPARRLKPTPVHMKPDPWAALGPLGEKATRSATALAELAVQTTHAPDTWTQQRQIADMVAHEILHATDKAWHSGITHGEWLAAQKVEDAKRDLDKLTGLQANLYDLQLRFQVLEGKYNEAKAALQLCSLRDISNEVVNTDGA